MFMLRFHLTSDDLTHVRMAGQPLALWDIIFSLNLLQNRQAALVFDPWRHAVRRQLEKARLTSAVAMLSRLYFEGGHAPDFLVATPDVVDLDSALDAVLSTPRMALRGQLTELVRLRRRPLPSWSRDLAEGDVKALKSLGAVLRRYYDIAVAPYTAHMREAFTAERSRCAELAMSDGVDGWLAGYPAHVMRWEQGVLATNHPFEADYQLEGRPLTFIPSFFAADVPVATGEQWIPPVIAYPIAHRLGWLTSGAQSPAAQQSGSASLSRLIGPARAVALDALGNAMTTTQLAQALSLSLPMASRHATILREAGLIVSQRRGQAVVHTRTPLGEALLNGESAIAVPPSGPCCPS
ncbi:winged helix-turn-helix domain-containing protein [Nonomuraea fuscirosea]|uniref:ArsR/SmtB family transcription factor n=1 Tax=Nonomuraea fuscirosea TaxID=1291556 RepID=UPI002DDA9515|nr:winged helix-turn-helix domain-containing protein [Nonomuraea fuscirosea]WSA52283.1 winged helix-turn-helix domain-containing protein [Nonomuraea fuscirosea]